MTITPEELRRRLGAELAALPVAPRETATERHARADRRRRRWRLTYASTGIALLATAAAVISLLVIGRPTSQAQVRPATPTIATPGDVDGDGIVDQVSLVGGRPHDTLGDKFLDDPTLVVRSSKYGRLTLPLNQIGVRLTNQAGAPLADVDLFGTGAADITVAYLGASVMFTEFVHVIDGRLVLLRDGTPGSNGLPFAPGFGDHGRYIETRWTCVSATGGTNQPGFIQEYGAATNNPPTYWEIQVQRYRLQGSTVVPAGPHMTTEAPFHGQPAPGADSYDECGTGAGN